MARLKEQTTLLQNKDKGRLPRLPFGTMKDAVLGKNYTLSIVFVSSAFSRTLNAKWRGKNKPTNVLSFPLSKNAGEIFLCKSVMRKEAPLFEKKYSEFCAYILIHGMLHLKGFAHGSTMEAKERFYLKKFKV